MSLFVDTGMWYAALDAGDRQHDRAKAVLGSGETLVVTDHVVIESWRLLVHRLTADVADQFIDQILLGAADLQIVTAADMGRAWMVRQRFADQGFSLVDCTSFVVMERLGLCRAASFDDDFAIYRFGPAGRAFEIVR